MKFAFFNVSAAHISGGLETSNWEVGRELSLLGHSVDILAGNRGGPRNDQVRLLQFPFKDRGEYLDLGSRYRRLRERLSFGAHAVDALVAGEYDVVVINKPFDFPNLARARRKGLNSLTVYRSGGTDFYAFDRRFARHVDVWLSSSGYNARQVEGRYGRPVTVIHNGVDTKRFHPMERDANLLARYGIPADAPLIISVGRLEGWKGFNVVIEAIADLPGAHYAFVGEGPAKRPWLDLADRLSVAHRVHALGKLPHADLPAILNLGHVFAQPSIGEEAFGITIVEAMACGLPVLGSDQGGIPEILTTDEVGVRLPTGDVSAWRETLSRLLTDNARRKKIGQAARQHVDNHFTWAANARKLVGCCEQALQAR